MKVRYNMKKKLYETPRTQHVEVELEQGFMTASIFEDENKHDEGLSTEVHGFANTGAEWEGDYGEDKWD